jgi:hypothetical protein
MPQLHLYVPDEVAETAKARARAAGKSLSSYLADLVVQEVAGEWPEGFFEEVVCGWKVDSLQRPNQCGTERRDRLYQFICFTRTPAFESSMERHPH